ncbi:MAG: hypothetical protein K1X72_24625 [Pyrinomonadaceae bacterium]|nr:hypothetical protein [Pyrinomonadaceae bacterium]
MKNLDRLFIILAIFIVLACRCNSDLFGSRRTRTFTNTTPYSTPKPISNSSTPTAGDFGEYRQCSERQNLNHNNTGSSAPLTINNGSQLTLNVYRLGANNYQSKYETVSPGKSVTLRSSLRGEWWMITDVSGNCQMIVAPPNVVNIK